MYAPPPNPATPKTPVRVGALSDKNRTCSSPYSLGRLADYSERWRAADASPTNSLGSPTRRSITATAAAAANESPSLRRKRSSANASLTARPSILSLRDQCLGGGMQDSSLAVNSLGDHLAALQLGVHPDVADGCASTSSTSPTASVTLAPSTLAEEWVRNVHDLILVHVDDIAGAESCRLGHALFRPNLLVTQSGDIVSISDHAQWSLIRSTVEEMRIVYRSATKQQPFCDDATCTFDISRADTTNADRATLPRTSSTFYIPALDSASESIGATDRLMALTVTGAGCSSGLLPLFSASPSYCIDQAKFEALPSQLRKLLRQTEEIIGATGVQRPALEKAVTEPIDGDDAAQIRREHLCMRIVELVREREHTGVGY